MLNNFRKVYLGIKNFKEFFEKLRCLRKKRSWVFLQQGSYSGTMSLLSYILLNLSKGCYSED